MIANHERIEIEPIYSIGEENGPGNAKTVEWSPLGVSRRRGYWDAVLDAWRAPGPMMGLGVLLRSSQPCID